MNTFAPKNSVQFTVKMTRLLYAQLVSQHVEAPRPFTMVEESDPSYQAHQLGMKIACGFEMLIHDPYEEDIHAGKSNLDSFPFDHDPDFKFYLGRLESYGFFKVLSLQVNFILE
jgi:hypothetical protein